MKVRNRRILEKYLIKKRGNNKLEKEIIILIDTLEKASWSTPEDVKASRPDADKVHSGGFYFFNIVMDRTMILIELEDKIASIIWVGNHDNYESTFKNNKSTIRRWLRSQKLI